MGNLSAPRGRSAKGEERLIALLKSVAVWELPESGWGRVDEALGLLDLALDGRTELLARAEGMLMMAGPRRAEKGLADVLDTRRPQPVPAPTRELANRLLRQLGPVGRWRDERTSRRRNRQQSGWGTA
ncbi:hypothetical protein GCM10010103_77910 [Streptomyces paradoxus]|uniref:CATRA-Associated Small Protein domain-containing protein n=1 Tax=Streptomyces paradoxus TaxID=66375 RepID=A0A7W9TL64_9ACTN|nr:CATRA system-associated protein [Streptomyces paradoxus]MBB6081898.1 hypothetical protein [Streptomyces paradoxus]